MRRMTSLAQQTRSTWLLALAALVACSDESVPAAESDTTADGGINSLSGADTGDTTASPSTTGMTTMGSMSGDSTTGGPDCADGVQNGDETDVDCGGSCGDQCGEGQGCIANEDCQSLSCSGGECQMPTCFDGIQNGNEDGIDCGSNCSPCGNNNECDSDGDCRPGEFCSDQFTCDPSACDNRIQDTHESDVDCGGADCPDCGPGANCNVNADCESHVCEPGTDTCADATCDDGVQNGDETDEDCGGSCPGCANSSSCEFNSDCLSGVCEGGNCEAPGCNDGVQNGNETAEDCGGSCGPCGDGDGCGDGSDCVSGVCTDMVCAVPTCSDSEFNGDETDEDCGGQCGATCGTGEDCFDGGDCIQGVCEFGQCSVPDCLDNVENGDETDLDCGGSCGATCDVGQDCIDAGDCEPGVCEMSLCSVPDCFDGIENGDETDVDCGASCGSTCDTGDQCVDDDDCVSLVCTANTCQAPLCNDGVDNGDEAGIDCEGSCPDPCDFGGEIQVNTYELDSQLAPTIGAAPDGSYYVVAWVSVPINAAAQDGSSSGIYAQMYDDTGAAIGAEFLVNTTTVGAQTNPSVAVHDAGFIVTWESTDGLSGGVFAKTYDNTGAVVTAQFQVNSNSAGLQRRPDVAADNGGAFVICFEDQPVVPMGPYNVLCGRYNAAAQAQGQLTANFETDGDQQLPSVGRTSAGSFVVAWQGPNAVDSSQIDVYMRGFDNLGGELIAETLVNVTTLGNQSQPSIAVNASGEFVIAWTSDNVDGSSTAVMGRRYDTAGAPLGGEFTVNTYTTGAQNNPAVGINADGDSIVAWVSANQDGNLTGVYAQRYDQAGVGVGAEFRVNTVTTFFQEEPDITLRTSDEPIVAYSSGSATDRDVFLRRFNASFP